MDSTLLTRKTEPTSTVSARTRWMAGHQGRRIREAILAYAFLLPSFLIVGLFGLFPLLFAGFESTRRGLNNIIGPYNGLGNYVQAIGDLAYVLFFWIAALLIFLAFRGIVEAVTLARERNENVWRWATSGIITGAGLLGLVYFIFHTLPLLLEVPGQLRGRNNTPENFRRLIGEAFMTPSVQLALWGSLLVLAIGVGLLYWIGRQRSGTRPANNYAGPFINATVMLGLAALLAWLTWTEISNAYAEAIADGTPLDLWANILTMSAGFLLLGIAWWLWESASRRASNLGFVWRLGAAAMLLVGAWFLIGELPVVLAAGDRRWWLGVINTFWYSLGTIPAQLAIALLLAVLLFQDIKGKSVFRMIYFIPYIAPFVGTAAVFRILFSSRPSTPLNSLISFFGGDPMRWLSEPTGVFQLLLGNSVTLPEWIAGPSLSLIVIMVYGVWTFVGFNTVIFMAGLGSIPRDVYEAGAMDGAGRWAIFRYITMPLLSPTIYFLTLYSVIGTFKAFNHIYVLRTPAALGTTDTASVVIFALFRETTRYGYASALAILLLVIILALTAINNRIASERVFYG
ncbi:MAG: sugar ABC transporter permease [Caldilineaceae bacterium]|nr:sugar ABC transporter permease [Caldilineaceae bacterium]